MRKYTAAKAAIQELREMKEELLLIKILGNPTGIVYEARAIAEFILDAKSEDCGLFAPVIEFAHQEHAKAVAAYCASHGLSGPAEAGREALIDLLVQLLPVILQMLPTLLALCPK